MAEELCHHGIHIRDLAVIGSFRVAALVGLGRIVWVMGVEKVHPYEERAFRVLLQPGERVLNHFPTAALYSLIASLRRIGVPTKTGVIGVKSAFKTGRSPFEIYRDRSDKRGRGIAVLLQDRGQVGEIFRQGDREDQNLVVLGIGPGENR